MNSIVIQANDFIRVQVCSTFPMLICSIPVVATVTAKIYDLTGKQIRMIELGHVTAESYIESSKAIYWDEKTDSGETVAS